MSSIVHIVSIVHTVSISDFKEILTGVIHGNNSLYSVHTVVYGPTLDQQMVYWYKTSETKWSNLLDMVRNEKKLRNEWFEIDIAADKEAVFYYKTWGQGTAEVYLA